MPARESNSASKRIWSRASGKPKRDFDHTTPKNKQIRTRKNGRKFRDAPRIKNPAYGKMVKEKDAAVAAQKAKKAKPQEDDKSNTKDKGTKPAAGDDRK